jgi:uncharacterized protein YdeI (BOF family)
LLSLNGQNIQEINYSGAKEGKSYSYNQILGNWFWSDTPTPGLENQSPLVNNQQIAGLFSKEPEQKFYQISELKELEKGTKIITQGIVTVLPGILGKKVFYVAEVDLVKKKAFASPGLEVYSSISEFPKLTIGDVVEFSGKVSEVQGKKRINLQKDSQINIIDHWKLPAPEVMATGETSEDLVGSLVSISGILLEKKGSNYFLDDGSGEIKIFFKNSTNIKNPTVKVGETLEVSGILDLTSAGFRLLPPSSDDVRIGKVLGETVMADEEIKINSDNQRKGVKKYLLWGGGGTLVLLIVALLKNGFRQR